MAPGGGGGGEWEGTGGIGDEKREKQESFYVRCLSQTLVVHVLRRREYGNDTNFLGKRTKPARRPFRPPAGPSFHLPILPSFLPNDEACTGGGGHAGWVTYRCHVHRADGIKLCTKEAPECFRLHLPLCTLCTRVCICLFASSLSRGAGACLLADSLSSS